MVTVLFRKEREEKIDILSTHRDQCWAAVPIVQHIKENPHKGHKKERLRSVKWKKIKILIIKNLKILKQSSKFPIC